MDFIDKLLAERAALGAPAVKTYVVAQHPTKYRLGKRPLSTATIQLPAAATFPVGRCEYSFDPNVTVRLNLPLRL